MQKHEWVNYDQLAPECCSECGHSDICVVHFGGAVKCHMWHNTACEVDDTREGPDEPKSSHR